MRILFGMVLVLALSACAGTPERYYSLTPVHDAAGSPSGQAADFAIRVDPVRVPAQIDRPQMVVRQDSGPGVLVLNQSLWAAPLTDDIRGMLARELSRRLHAADATHLPAPAGMDVWELDVEVRRFELMDGAWTELDLNWSLKSNSHPNAVSAICNALIRQPVATPGVAPLIDGQREALQRFAATVSEAIRANENRLERGGLKTISCT